MSEILLVNSKLTHHGRNTVSPPLNLAYLYAALRDNNINCNVFDCNLGHESFSNAVCQLPKNGVVAFSSMTPNYNYTVELAKTTKSIRPDLFTAIGGYHASLFANEIIWSDAPFDAVFLGNGEESIVRFCNDYRKKDFTCKPGIIFRQDRNNAIYTIKASKWPNGITPDRDAINLKEYIAMGSDFSGSVQFSRGCVFSCNFCSVRHVEGCWQAGDINQLLKEFEILHYKYGLFTNIVIVDNLFNGNKKLVIEFCDLLIKSGLGVKWSCDVRIDGVDKELVSKMYEAGCSSYFVGLESGNEKTLQLIGNKARAEEVKNKLEMIKDIGIKVNASFIIGMPWENEDSILETIEYAINLPLYTREFSFATPFPNTLLYRQFSEYGAKIIETNYNYWDGMTPVMSIPNISRNRLVELNLYALSQMMAKEGSV